MANWEKITARGTVDDRRASPPYVKGGLTITGVVIVLIYALVSGEDPSKMLNEMPAQSGTTQTQDNSEFEGLDSYELYVTRVMGSADSLWKSEFASMKKTYRTPTTVLFRGATESGCGGASSASGPHYCPADETIYLDETFFEVLTKRFGARGGEVAQAYVLAHEAGHHVQHLLGTTQLVRTNEDSIALELQADCYAGVWAKSVEDQDIITLEEVDQAIDAAAAVGDDRIQEKTTGRINPESWTHGSSAQRKQWFLVGFETGDPNKCNTI